MTRRIVINTRYFTDISEEHEQGKKWLEVPLFRWLNDNIGPMNLDKEEGEVLHGQGWHFGSNIDQWHRNKHWELADIRYWVDFEEPIDDRLLIEFALRWGA
jgi:hypothetical protein